VRVSRIGHAWHALKNSALSVLASPPRRSSVVYSTSSELVVDEWFLW